ncbi:MAG: DNA integrity scanning protein DisA nucleotide-binding domain protein [Nanoarchaeota archaeon]
MNNKKFFDALLNSKIKDLSSTLDIDHIAKIEGKTNLETDKIETLDIIITCLENNITNFLEVENDFNIDTESKLKNILLSAIDLKYLKKDSVVLFIFDKSISNNLSFGILVLEVSKVLYRIARFKLTEFMDNEKVLEEVLQICEEIRKEGREGKNIGTLFLIGNEEELQPFLRPLILNPFYGYPENFRDLLNNDLRETIKEYAQLDGAFIINNKGIVLSAGTYIDVDTKNVKKYYGWGTKHLAAVAITSQTKSIGVLISESGNLIKLFKNGKLILKY